MQVAETEKTERSRAEQQCRIAEDRMRAAEAEVQQTLHQWQIPNTCVPTVSCKLLELSIAQASSMFAVKFAMTFICLISHQ